MEVNFTDTCPDTGMKRFVEATRHARIWSFRYRYKRREDWKTAKRVTRSMWEELIDAIERRIPRKEASEEDLKDCKREWAKAPEEVAEGE